MEKVIIGISGGVDSFVAALLLQQQGFEVIGVHLQLWKSETSSKQETEVEELCKTTEHPTLQTKWRRSFYSPSNKTIYQRLSYRYYS